MFKSLLLSTTLVCGSLLAVSSGAQAVTFGPATGARAFDIDSFNTSFVGGSSDSGFGPNQDNQDIWLGRATPGVIASPSPPFPRTGPNPYNRTLQPIDQVIGGSRNLRMNLLTNPTLAVGAARARLAPNTPAGNVNSLSVTNISTANSTTTTRWDGNGMGLDATGQQDFAARVNNKLKYSGFGIDFNSIRGTVDVTINVVTGNSGPMQMASQTITGLTSDTTLGQFRFTDFLAVDPTLNFSDVKYIELVLNGPVGFGVDIDSFFVYEIPEPSSAFSTLVLVGLGLASWKRKQDEDQ